MMTNMGMGGTGMRAGIAHNRGGKDGQSYMSVVSQDPNLQNVGGAKITYN